MSPRIVDFNRGLANAVGSQLLQNRPLLCSHPSRRASSGSGAGRLKETLWGEELAMCLARRHASARPRERRARGAGARSLFGAKQRSLERASELARLALLL